jgi:hypothetical protein
MLYSLKYEMMVQIVRQFKYSGQFRADILAQVALKEGGQAILIVNEGRITSCFILNKYGQKLYTDMDAVSLLLRLGVLDWQLVSSPAPPSISKEMAQSSLPSIATRSAGTNFSMRLRHVPVQQSQIRTWSTLQRSVYALADGTRSIEQIAILLSRPLDMIEQVMRLLQESGVVEEVS